MTKHRIRLVQTMRAVREVTFEVEANTLEEALQIAEDGDFPDGDYRTINQDIEGWSYYPA